MDKNKPIQVPIDSLKLGPLQHKSLPESLLKRIRVIHEGTKELFGGETLEQTEINFMRDIDPEGEVRWWEALLRSVDKVMSAIPNLERKKVIRTLFGHYMNPSNAKNDEIAKTIIDVAENG